MSFDRKHRKNISYKLRYNHLEDVDEMIRLNLERFKEESDFGEREMQLSFKKLAQTAKKQNRLRLTSLLISGRVEAVIGKKMKLEFLSSDSGWNKWWHLEEKQLFEFKN